ncbi:MAG: hypothetical protein BGO31_06540 [Bacteroidetes bacterium 43-16]|nr:MAG: hypothetical protein BGO31_06540 [Bacteroidetes bacterium 43-16]
MAQSVQEESIDNQIKAYVSSLSDKNKQAVLTVVRTIAEAEEEAVFEKNWGNAVPLEKARAHTLETVRKRFNERDRFQK